MYLRPKSIPETWKITNIYKYILNIKRNLYLGLENISEILIYSKYELQS